MRKGINKMTLRDFQMQINKICDVCKDGSILVKFKVYDRNEDTVIEADTIVSMKVDVMHGKDVVIGLS